MLQRFGLWPVVVVLVLAFALTAWTANEKLKPPPVVAVCEPAPAPAADAPAAPVASGSVSAEEAFKRLPWKPGADVQKTASGLQYVVLAHGDPKGAHPKATDTVAVLYDGRLAANGKPFDSTQGDETASFAVNKVIPGWTEGLQLMVPGDQVMFFIPSNLAYGDAGAGGVIPPKADLVFLVTLKKIVVAQTAYEACWKKALPWKKAGGHKLAKGIQYFSVAEGPKSEPLAAPTDIVSVFIDARLEDGKSLGSNFGGRAFTGPVNEVGPGLDEVLPKMRQGDHWFIQLPNEVATAGAPPGPNTPAGPVILEVLLDKVIHIPASPTAPAPGGPPPAQSTTPAGAPH
jgi:FKBP-type peptidyl-prolyl cis-trans isomerase